MVDNAKVDQILSNLRSYRKELQKLADVTRDVFLSDTDKIGSAKYHFVVAIECCIDVANHIISSENLPFAESNVKAFVTLIENGWLPESMRDRLTAMAKFQNRLVHLYWKIDDEKVYRYLNESLVDFDRFGEAITSRLKSQR